MKSVLGRVSKHVVKSVDNQIEWLLRQRLLTNQEIALVLVELRKGEKLLLERLSTAAKLNSPDAAQREIGIKEVAGDGI